MAITPVEADGALRQFEQAEARTRQMLGYRTASPYLFLWGIIWALGYGLCGVTTPRHWGAIWLPLDAVGVAASIWLGAQAQARRRRSGEQVQWHRYGPVLAMGLISLFVVASYSLFHPQSPAQFLVFPVLVTGLVYGLFGMMRMTRLLTIGAAMIVLAAAGQAWLGNDAQMPLALWLAAVGGGGLMVGGIWLRTV